MLARSAALLAPCQQDEVGAGSRRLQAAAPAAVGALSVAGWGSVDLDQPSAVAAGWVNHRISALSYPSPDGGVFR